MASAIDLSAYKETMILLGTAGVVVPLVHRLKISPILGYIAAGAILGPHVLGALVGKFPLLSWVTVQNTKDIAGLAELGVVFLLFVIGLELSPKRLVTMRRFVFGLGTLQVVITAAILTAAIRWGGLPPQAAVLAGLALALSSTAIVVELLARQDRMSSSTGRASISVLLMQDLAVVPILFLIGALGEDGKDISVARGLGQAMLQAVAALTAIVLLGLFLLRPLFRLVAATASIELFVAATLFVALGCGVLTASAGLSMALGAFVAGLLLAESEFRRAIEATIEPFKGLLLGVFFFSVGMLIDIGMLWRHPVLILAAAIGLVAVKTALYVPMARLFGLSWPTAIESGLLIGPCGEFAFIIIGLALAEQIVPVDAAAFLLAVVALTMAMLPLLAPLGRRLASSWISRSTSDPLLLAVPPAAETNRAIVVGYGRVGSLVVDMLKRHDVPHIATEINPRSVTRGRNNGDLVYYGDAKSALFLERCNVRQATALIITIHTSAEIDAIVEAARSMRADIPIIARARDAAHAQHLYGLGVTDAVPETIEASLQLSEAALVAIGVPTGPVIASIHEKRDEFRSILQKSAQSGGRETTHGIKRKTQGRSAKG